MLLMPLTIWWYYLIMIFISTSILELATVGSLWLENDCNENELEFAFISHGIHGNPQNLTSVPGTVRCVWCHVDVNPCLQSKSENLRKNPVTWMSQDYVFTLISHLSIFSSTVNLCNSNCVFSVTPQNVVLWFCGDTHSVFLGSPHCDTVHNMPGCP